VSVGGQSSVGVWYDYLSLSQPPVISKIDPVRGPTRGGTAVLFTGSRFTSIGQVYFVHPTTGEQRECLWDGVDGMFYTDTMIRCLSPRGEGAGWRVSVVGSLVPSVETTVTWSYDKPVLLSVAPQSVSPLGGDVLSIGGVNFGESGSVTVNNRACDVVMWSDDAVSCVSPAGARAVASVIVSSGGQSNVYMGSDSDTIEYGRPVVIGVNVSVLSSSGGEGMRVVGGNFSWPFVSVWLTQLSQFEVWND
jgi:hypothetical protein